MDTYRMLLKYIATFALIVLYLTGPLSAQDSKPYLREAAEESFRALVAAKDKDVLNLIKADALVCFADSLPFNVEDRFPTLELPKPDVWFVEKPQTENTNSSEEHGTFYDGKTDFPVAAVSFLSFHVWENQDWEVMIDSSLVDGKWHSYGHYERLKSGQSLPKRSVPSLHLVGEAQDEVRHRWMDNISRQLF